MNFLRKKRFKFQVDFLVADLCEVPNVNAVLYVKVRLLEGGTFSDESSRLQVFNHHVCWGQLFQFSCRVPSDTTTAILEPCYCRVSVRKEQKGGKSFDKIGFVDVNLSEFAGSGVDGITRSYILEGYNSGQNRQDNSILRINVSLTLQSSDPLFKVPKFSNVGPPDLQDSSRFSISAPNPEDLNPLGRKAPSAGLNDDRDSIHSTGTSSSGIDSLSSRNKRGSDIPPGLDDDCWVPGHSRNASSASQQSTNGMVGGSGALTLGQILPLPSSGAGGLTTAMITSSQQNKSHSRQSSSDTGFMERRNLGSQQQFEVSTLPKPSTSNALTISDHHAMKRQPSSEAVNRRVNVTRLDPGDVVEELIRDHHLCLDDVEGGGPNDSGGGLQLFISRHDGTAALVGSNSMRASAKASNFEPVIIDR